MGQSVHRQDDQGIHGRTTDRRADQSRRNDLREVYGRIALFKFGAGYRNAPRTEGVFNFVWSNSDANDAATPIGTAGSPGVPLSRALHPVQLLGLRGRTALVLRPDAFTPFVGYLVGINRHQDIRGTFVGVPANATPGLAAQDGKFFEKSWALSLGPTGGCSSAWSH